MKDYEIMLKYLNGCAGEAHPLTSFQEATLSSPEDFLREKHKKDFPYFVKEQLSPDQTRYTFRGPAVTYIYEFTEL